jgi:hypothetical protein
VDTVLPSKGYANDIYRFENLVQTAVIAAHYRFLRKGKTMLNNGEIKWGKNEKSFIQNHDI